MFAAKLQETGPMLSHAFKSSYLECTHCKRLEKSARPFKATTEPRFIIVSVAFCPPQFRTKFQYLGVQMLVF